MKKIFALILILVLSASLFACSSGTKETSAPAVEPETVETETAKAEEKTRDLPEGSYEEMGEGTTYLSTPSGTSENGNIPFIYAKKDLILMQIGLNAWDFNGGALSFIYVDGMLVDKEQLANTQTSLDLQGEQLSEGLHSVEVVQYENDDPTASMITYRIMQYEIKAA